MGKHIIKPTILIVDDEKDIRDFLQYNLEKEEYNVFFAKDGEEAVEMTKKVSPSLILMDVMMPEIDGIEACRKIRNDLTILQPIIIF